MADSPIAQATTAPGPFVALRYRDFRFFLASALLSTIGLQMQAVAVGWQVYALTGQALDLGYVGLALFAPSLLFAAVTGQAADRFDRRKLLITCHVLLFCASVLLLAIAELSRSLPAIYAILVLIGSARAFGSPTSQALMPNLVPLSAFPNAVAWSSTSWQISVVAGPALGGLLYAAAGAGGVYACSTLLEALTVVVLLAVRARSVRPARAPSSLHELSAGLRFVWQQPVILGAISLDLFAVLFGGAVALLPIYARDILHAGPRGLGLLRSAPALGALAVALWLAYRPVLRRSGVTMFVCVALFGLATIVFALSEHIGLSIAALAFTGAVDMVSVFIRHSLVQLRTPDVMRGRVAAVNMIFIGASNELGEFESGVVAQWLGTVPAVVVGGIATCVVVVLWALWFPALRRIDRLDATELTAEEVGSRRVDEASAA
jgi:MFS family permease